MNPPNLDDAEKRVKIPVQVLSNGTVAMESGAALPKIKPGSLGDLVLPADSLENPTVVSVLNESVSAIFLVKGEVMWVRLYPRDPATNELTRFDQETLHPKMAGHMFAPVTLLNDLKLVTRGTKRGQLEKARCSVPAGDGGKGVDATSLNHAYRLLSQRFERHRVSFGGNIFTAAFVKREGTWHHLEALRRAAESKARLQVDQAIATIEKSSAQAASRAPTK